MLVLTCCASNRTEPQIKYIVKYIYEPIPLSFPEFPAPADGLIIPYDVDGKKVTTADVEITNVLIPYWYWNLIIKYKCDVDVQEDFYKRCTEK